MSDPNNVPVMISGVNVGSARIHVDGRIEVTIKPNAFGRELLMGVETGIFTALAIRAVHKAAAKGKHEASLDITCKKHTPNKGSHTPWRCPVSVRR